jgi:hypothetical protein
MEEATEDDILNGVFDVSVLKHQMRRSSTKLESDRFDVFSSKRTDDRANTG